jgi:hypothetical protein
MLWWLADNATLVCLFLLVAALVLGFAWWGTRRGGYLVGAGVAAALFALVWALGLFVMTDRKRLVQTVNEVARLINAEKYDAAFDHFAEEAELDLDGVKSKLPRKQLQDMAGRIFKRPDVGGLVVWEVEAEKVQRPEAVVSFYARPANQQGYARCTATFVLHGDRDWRVKSLKAESVGDKLRWLAPR